MIVEVYQIESTLSLHEKMLTLDDTHFNIVVPHIDVDGEVSHLHLKVLVVKTVHVVVAVEIISKYNLHVMRHTGTLIVVVFPRLEVLVIVPVTCIFYVPSKRNLAHIFHRYFTHCHQTKTEGQGVQPQHVAGLGGG